METESAKGGDGSVPSEAGYAEDTDGNNTKIHRVLISEDLAVLFIDVLHRSNPFGLAVRVIATARTLYHAKSLRDQFIRGEMIFETARSLSRVAHKYTSPLSAKSFIVIGGKV